MDFPIGKPSFKSTDPFRYPGLSSVDLLTSTDKTYDCAPIWMPIHHTNKELRLRHVEVGLPSFALHEASRLLSGPGPLCFVKHHHFLDRDIVVADIMISKVVNILDKAAYLALGCFLSDALTLSFVSRKCLSEHINKWAIAGQKDGVLIAMFIGTACRYIQPGQSFP